MPSTFPILETAAKCLNQYHDLIFKSSVRDMAVFIFSSLNKEIDYNIFAFNLKANGECVMI